LFRARDPQPDDPIVAYSRNYIDDPKWGWGQICDHVDVRWVPGDHISMLAEPNVLELAAKLAADQQPAVNDPLPAAPPARVTASA
jgi:thioesterase domain-containing protein